MSVLVAARNVGAMESVKKTKLLLFEFINQDRHMCTCLIFISSIFCNSIIFCVDSSLDLKIHFSVVGIYKNSRIIVKVNKCWRKNDNRIILYELKGGLSRQKIGPLISHTIA